MRPGSIAAEIDNESLLTPAGIQPQRTLLARRILVVTLNGASYCGLLVWLASILGTGVWSPIDVAIFICFAIAAPWSVLGLWNALLGLWLLHGSGNPLHRVAPFAQAGDGAAPISSKTALVMTLRNEDPGRALARLETIKRGLDATGAGAQFSYFVLSDTDVPDIAAAEEAAMQRWKIAAGADAERLVYRRRTTNTGFKAGNLRDFCDCWGEAYEFMLPLDADSLMSAGTILRLVRIAQAYPKLGILQSLVVGAPARSAFARIFQFGMRHGMRPYTTGSAWWSGDCGPFWGHNALVRIAAFRVHCELPVLPGKPPLGGRILSHDQVEAALMRAAGYEVRVLPEECGSYEDNPPTLFEFIRRDLRWCQGNLQYWRLVTSKGLRPTSRFQLVWAIMMFAGVPAWTAIIALAALKPFDGKSPAEFPAASAELFYLTFLVAHLAPKLAGFADIALTAGGLSRYGGGWRFAAGALTELLFSFLLGAATTLCTGLFMIGLIFGRSATWSGQMRDAHALSTAAAARSLWPHMLFGGAVLAAAAIGAPILLLWSLPLTLGYVLAVPFAVITASPTLGAALARSGICAIPEEIDKPDVIAALDHEIGKAERLAAPAYEIPSLLEPA